MEQQIKEVLSKVFGVDLTEIDENTSSDTLENWDSLRQMNLVVALEEEFEVEFTDEQILEMLSFKLIVHIIKEALEQ
ncbi:MAG: acyl carrier protein [SAR324 cluster bacterium]|nr:acyl carrier protein [SAR324 cluster bacterium]